MKITRVQSQIVKLPAEEPLAGGPGFYRPFFEFVALRMLTDEGIEGLGITFFGWALTATLKHAVDQLSEFVIGEDPLRLEAVGRKVRNAVAGAGRDDADARSGARQANPRSGGAGYRSHVRYQSALERESGDRYRPAHRRRSFVLAGGRDGARRLRRARPRRRCVGNAFSRRRV